MDRVFKILEDVINNEKMIYAVFSNVRKGVDKDCNKLKIKPVVIKNERVLQFEYEYDKKVKHENLKGVQAIDVAFGLIKTYFKQAMIYTIDADYQVLVSKKGVPKVLEKAPSRNTVDLKN